MADVDTEIAAYELMRPKLEADHTSKWALVHDRELIGLFDDFETAAADAVRRFGRGPYLIRQIGAPPMTLPASFAAQSNTPAQGVAREVFALETGEAVLQWPTTLNAEGVQELEDWLALVVKKLKRLKKASSTGNH